MQRKVSRVSDEEFSAKLASIPDALPRRSSEGAAAYLPLNLTPKPVHQRSAGVARNQAKQMRWRSQLDRVYGWLDSVATSALDRERLAAAYQAELGAGPDFVRFRSGSDFKTPVAADRAQLNAILREFEAVARNSWRADRQAAVAEGKVIRRTIPRTCAPVLNALVTLARRHTAVFPSLARLASMAQCSRRTACRALDVLKSFGFVIVHRRRKRVQTAFGPRQVQDTSCYQLRLPSEGRGLGRMAALLFGRKFRPGSECKTGAAISPPNATSFKPPSDTGNLLPLSPTTAPTGRLRWSVLAEN